MNQTMNRLLKMKKDEYSSFVRVLFGLTTPSPISGDLSEGEGGQLEWIEPSLNDSQKDAIRFALASREVALIRGPPGVCTFPFFVFTPCAFKNSRFTGDGGSLHDLYLVPLLFIPPC